MSENISEGYERVQSDEAVKKFNEESELARNSCLIRKIKLPPGDGAFIPNGVLFPDRTYESEYTGRDWWQTWQKIRQEIVENGDCMAVALDCHL